MLTISVKDLVFKARLETEVAPVTVAAFQRLLPLRSKIIQARWSGEAGWIPFGTLELDLPWENATVYPGAGELLLYRGGYSETEILFPYGRTRFGSTMGDLAGNHFATVTEGREKLPELGRRVLWEGAQEINIEESGEA
ncbi:MAG: DUF3830 family protein [Candidatus Dormibacter sp.]|uniref:DUF3830 family protein n=1 Tax=Candidatus Dormibacter sp. TaxID=2973982 RepID=UPI000DB25A1A|nr:MAG: DUF3830 domain-containing protein [Candidatus Dormibacteraeota bacterium]